MHNAAANACVCVGVHNSCNSILCKCTLWEWVFKSTLVFFCVGMCLLINGKISGNGLHHDFIYSAFSLTRVLTSSVRVQDGGCEPCGRQAAVHRGAGDSDHGEHDCHLQRSGEAAAAQQEHRAPQS